METVRKPFEGVFNIIRFNWPMYVGGMIVFITALSIAPLAVGGWNACFNVLAWLSFMAMFVSLAVSWYVYDLSGFYRLNFLPPLIGLLPSNIVQVHAGFDETSGRVQQLFPTAHLTLMDFYDPALHTEPSIERARNAYPAAAATIYISTKEIPLAPQSIDLVLAIFALHEIRNERERIHFFSEIHRVLASNGRVVVTEHLRNWTNFLAYHIGFLHFYSDRQWQYIFKSAGFTLKKKHWNNPFVVTYILTR